MRADQPNPISPERAEWLRIKAEASREAVRKRHQRERELARIERDTDIDADFRSGHFIRPARRN